MSDYDKITESSNRIKGLFVALLWDIIKIVFLGALWIDLMFD